VRFSFIVIRIHKKKLIYFFLVFIYILDDRKVKFIDICLMLLFETKLKNESKVK
jgi:hypothetical protein